MRATEIKAMTGLESMTSCNCRSDALTTELL